MRLIVLLVGDPPRDKMPEDIQNYIKSGSYLTWGEKWFWKKLIYKMPHVTREPRPLDPSNYGRSKFKMNKPNGDVRTHDVSFSDDGEGMPLGSIFSETTEPNETKSEISVEIHDNSFISDGYVSQTQSVGEFYDDTDNTDEDIDVTDTVFKEEESKLGEEEEENDRLLEGRDSFV